MMEVKKKCCGQCLFSKNKIVSDERKEQILSDCTRNDTHFICHKASIEGKDIVCAAFYKQYSTNMLRISERLGMLKKVD